MKALSLFQSQQTPKLAKERKNWNMVIAPDGDFSFSQETGSMGIHRKGRVYRMGNLSGLAISFLQPSFRFPKLQKRHSLFFPRTVGRDFHLFYDSCRGFKGRFWVEMLFIL